MTDQPGGMHGVIPYLSLEDADAALAFYGRAFGAKLFGEPARGEAGQILNATVLINGGALMLMHSDDRGPPAKGGQGIMLQLVMEDAEPFWTRAIAAGCEVLTPFETQFWGDRWGRFRDPFGLDWALLEPSADNMARSKTLVPTEIPQ